MQHVSFLIQKCDLASLSRLFGTLAVSILKPSEKPKLDISFELILVMEIFSVEFHRVVEPAGLVDEAFPPVRGDLRPLNSEWTFLSLYKLGWE